MLSSLNPHARLMETTYSQVDLTEILNTGLFTEEWAETQTNWLDNPGDAW